MTNQNNIEIPKVKTVDFPILTNDLPEIVNINYDLWTLRITLLFEKIDRPIYVTFKRIRGFRVLDEGNLLEFWNPAVRIPGWIWLVENGGWFDLEKKRGGFVESNHDNELLKEYLITGINDCISIFSTCEPEIKDSE
jgi:hypothetical protein